MFKQIFSHVIFYISIDISPNNDGQLVIKKTPTGETESRGFSLKPTNPGMANGQQQQGESAAFTITSDTIDSASMPVDCRGFSLNPSDQPLPALAVDSRGIPLKSRVVSLKETVDSEDGRGFDLKPVSDLLAIIDQEVGGRNEDAKEDAVGAAVEDDSEEDTPPPDSLRSIKEKVKARKSFDTKSRTKGKKILPVKRTESPVRPRGTGKGNYDNYK